MSSNYQSYNRNGASTESRYSKDQLLDLFRAQERDGFSSTNVDNLFVDGWNPAAVNGTSNGGWGKRDDNKEAAGPDICWDHQGTINPISLQKMSEEEEEVTQTLTTTVWKKMIADEESRHSLHLSIRHLNPQLRMPTRKVLRTT